MGTNDHPLGEVGIKVNDNQYHVIRFTRSGANSTLQVDDYNFQSNHPSGEFLFPFIDCKSTSSRDKHSLFANSKKYPDKPPDKL